MSPRNADPRVVRAEQRVAADCALGDHERCEGVHATTQVRCTCGCHIEPWPFEHDG